jgi:hypothetical protein
LDKKASFSAGCRQAHHAGHKPDSDHSGLIGFDQRTLSVVRRHRGTGAAKSLTLNIWQQHLDLKQMPSIFIFLQYIEII